MVRASRARRRAERNVLCSYLWLTSCVPAAAVAKCLAKVHLFHALPGIILWLCAHAIQVTACLNYCTNKRNCLDICYAQSTGSSFSRKQYGGAHSPIQYG